MWVSEDGNQKEANVFFPNYRMLGRFLKQKIAFNGVQTKSVPEFANHGMKKSTKNHVFFFHNGVGFRIDETCIDPSN